MPPDGEALDALSSGREPTPAPGPSDVRRPAGKEEKRPSALTEAELSRRFRDRLRLFAARRLDDPAAAEDVAQETLRRVVEALREERIEDLEALPAYVFQTARHVCQHRHRSAKRERRALGRLKREAGAPGGDPLAHLVDEERRRAVHRALGKLREPDRRLLRLFFYEGLDTRGVARRLKISRGATRVRKHRALKRLWDAMTGEEEGRRRATEGRGDAEGCDAVAGGSP